jgi:hypothetical protein
LSYGMDRFVEFSRTCSHRRGRLIRSSDYPKRGYILTLLLYCLPFQWTSALREANCRHGQFAKAVRWRKQVSRGETSRRIPRIMRNPAPAKTS